MTPERLIDGVFRVIAPSGSSLGTAFKVGTQTLITCDHVARQSADLRCVARSGKASKVDKVLNDELAAFDLALLRLHEDLGGVIPISSEPIDIADFYSLGFQFESKGVRAAFPTEGTVRGSTDVRYEAGFTYDLHDVFVLGGSDIDAGTSGGPLIDKVSGVAIGVVLARMRTDPGVVGYAVPFRIAAAVPILAEVIANNDAIVPRFGRLLNDEGLEVAAKAQAQQSVTRLEHETLFDRSGFVERSELSALLNKFLTGSARLCPLVGLSGNGKTMQLANWALSHGYVLLRFRDVDAGHRHLGNAVADALRAMSVPPMPQPDTERLLRLLGSSRARVICVDGLNEIQSSIGPAFLSWWRESCHWLSTNNLRVIISSRPETWELVRETVNAKWIYHEEESVESSQTITISDFTEQEALTFCHQHNLDTGIVLQRGVRHPFLLRMAADLGGKVIEEGSLVERWIDIKIRDSLLTAPMPPKVTTRQLREMVTKVGGKMWETGRSWISRDDYFSVFYGDLSIGNSLVSNNLLSESPGGFRFSFDAAAEWLVSQSLTVNLTSSEQFWRREGWEAVQLGAVRDFVLRLCTSGNLESANHIIELATSASREQPGIEYMLLEIFAMHPQPNDVFSQIEDVVERHDFFGPDLGPLFRNSALSVEKGVTLARKLAKYEGSYEWEFSKWERLRKNVFANKWGVANASEMIERDPLGAFEALTCWFDDRTALRDGSSTIAHIAGGLIYFFAHLRLAETIKMLLEDDRSMATDTLRMIVKSHLDESAAIFRSITPSKERGQELRLLELIEIIVTENASDASKLSLEAILRRIRAESTFPEHGNYALQIILHLPSHTRNDEDAALNQFRAAPESISEYAIARLGSSRFEDVLQIFQEVTSSRSARYLTPLGYYKGPEENRLSIVRLIVDLASNRPSDPYHLSATLESMLYSIRNEESRLRGSITSAAKTLFLKFRDSDRVPLIYFVCGASPRHVLENELAAFFIENGIDTGEIQIMLQRCEQWPKPLQADLFRKALSAVRSSKTPERLQLVFLMALYWTQHRHALEQFYEILEREDVGAGGSPFRQFREIVAQRGLAAAREEIMGTIVKSQRS